MQRSSVNYHNDNHLGSGKSDLIMHIINADGCEFKFYSLVTLANALSCLC